MVGTSYTDLHFFTPVSKKQRKPSAILLLPPCSVQLQHCEDSATFSARWVILVISMINFYTVKTRPLSVHAGLFWLFPWSTSTLWRLGHFQCVLGYFGSCHDQLLHCKDSDTFSACWVILVVSMINFHTVSVKTTRSGMLFFPFPFNNQFCSHLARRSAQTFYYIALIMKLSVTAWQSTQTSYHLALIINKITWQSVPA